MAVVNHINTTMMTPAGKDSRWLTLEVCREYQRNKCTRTENECKFAHPPGHVEVNSGRVVACFDSIKGKCQRKDPPCKYLHPPQHLREQLLQNGRNNLILKSLQIHALQQQTAAAVLPASIIPMNTSMKNVAPAGGKPAVAYPTTVLPGPYLGAPQQMWGPSNPNYGNPNVTRRSWHIQGWEEQWKTNNLVQQQVYGATASCFSASLLSEAAATPQSRPAVSHPASFAGPHYLGTVPTTGVHQFSHYSIPTTMAFQGGAADGSTIVTPQVSSVIPTAMPAKPPAPRPDRLEPPMVEVLTASKKRPRDPADELVLPQLGLMPPYKRVAVENANHLGKGGIPMYQPMPTATAYHQATLMQLQQQPYYTAVPYSGEVLSAAYQNYLPQANPSLMVAGPSLGVGAAAAGGALFGGLPGGLPTSQFMPPTPTPSLQAGGMPVVSAAGAASATSRVPSNAYNVQYFDSHKQPNRSQADGQKQVAGHPPTVPRF